MPGMIIKMIINPAYAVKLVWRRLFPFGIVPKDKEAYRIGSWSYGKLERQSADEIFPGIGKTDVSILNVYEREKYTSMDPLEVLTVCAIVKHLGCKNILEIGTYDGNTTLNLAANSATAAQVTTVDLPPDFKGGYNLEIPAIYDNVTDRGNIGVQFRGRKEIESKIRQVFGDSASLDWSRLMGPFDCVLIDGNHHYKYVESDTQNALNNLTSNGIIIWHDYGMLEDVSRAVDSFSEKIKLHAIKGTRLAIGLSIKNWK